MVKASWEPSSDDRQVGPLKHGGGYVDRGGYQRPGMDE